MLCVAYFCMVTDLQAGSVCACVCASGRGACRMHVRMSSNAGHLAVSDATGAASSFRPYLPLGPVCLVHGICSLALLADLLQAGGQEELPQEVRVWVHIADPTRWLAGGPGCSQLLGEAALRGRSMYLPWCVCVCVCVCACACMHVCVCVQVCHAHAVVVEVLGVCLCVCMQVCMLV